MNLATSSMLGALQLEPRGPGHYTAPHIGAAHYGVFGGQLMAQSIVAALAGHEGKTAKTLHTVFARTASPEVPMEIAVDPIHSGRAFASSTVTLSQEDRLCTRSLVLMTADEPDFIRYSDAPPALTLPTPPPDGDGSSADQLWEVRIAGDVDVDDPDQIGPPELDVWTRFVGAPVDPVVSQALLAFATNGFLIGAAMRPHPGVGQAIAHKSISSAVLGHTITFHESFCAADWLLLAQRSPYAGKGRSYGRADVFDTDGRLVASFVQDNMIRAMPAGREGGL